jgi:hypothetical protein
MMKSLILVAMGLGASLGVAACGGNVIVDHKGIPGEGDGAFWIAYCNARASACGISADKCKLEETCARELLRDEVEDALLHCLMTECDEGPCVSQIASTFGVTKKGEQYDSACASYLAKCPNGNNDACRSTPIFADSLIDQVMPCPQALTCEEAAGCFEKVNASTGDVCKAWI